MSGEKGLGQWKSRQIGNFDDTIGRIGTWEQTFPTVSAHPQGWTFKPTRCALYNSEPNDFRNFTEPNLNQFSQSKYSNLEIEPNVMKKFKQNYKIQIRLIRKYKIQIQQKTTNPQDSNPKSNPCSSLCKAHSSRLRHLQCFPYKTRYVSNI